MSVSLLTWHVLYVCTLGGTNMFALSQWRHDSLTYQFGEASPASLHHRYILQNLFFIHQMFQQQTAPFFSDVLACVGSIFWDDSWWCVGWQVMKYNSIKLDQSCVLLSSYFVCECLMRVLYMWGSVPSSLIMGFNSAWMAQDSEDIAWRCEDKC